VQLDILAHRDVGDAARVPLGEIGDPPRLCRGQNTVWNADAHEEIPDRLALAARAADRAHAIALRVDPPPAEIRVEPFRRDRVPALAREALDLGIRGPGVERPLEPLRPLRLGFLARLGHACLQAERPSK
jgi:hypothetical protein